MVGQTAQALECLKAEGMGAVENLQKVKFDNLATGLRESAPVSVKNVNLLNQSAVYMCSGQLD